MADDTQANGGTPEAIGTGAGGETPPVDFDTWIAGQTSDVRGLLDKHTTGLRTALQTERENAKTLAKQLKDLGKTLDANSDAAKQVADLSGKLETEQKRAAFYEQAQAAGCRDLRLAWLAASADGLTLKDVQAQHPDLFTQPRPPATNAGNGAHAVQGGSGAGMNAFIRREAGRGG